MGNFGAYNFNIEIVIVPYHAARQRKTLSHFPIESIHIFAKKPTDRFIAASHYGLLQHIKRIINMVVVREYALCGRCISLHCSPHFPSYLPQSTVLHILTFIRFGKMFDNFAL